MVYEYLKQESQDQGVTLLTLNRPEKRNALSAQLRQEIVDCLDQLTSDETVKAVILTGQGPSFCGGFDLQEFAGGDTELIFKEATEYHRIVYNFAKPLIAAVNGPAFAGGMDLAAMCDLRIAVQGALFAQPQVRLGVPAAFDLMSTVLPQSLAREICLTGRTMDSEEARVWGFVNKIVADAELLTEANALALEISAAAASQAMKKQMINNQPDLFTE